MYYSSRSIYFLLFVINIQAQDIKKASVDIGKSITIKCPLNNARDVMWVTERKSLSGNMRVLENGSLFLDKVDSSNSGIYNCTRKNDVEDIRGCVKLTIRTPPPPILLTIKPSTIIVFLTWDVNGTGGYPITYFSGEYRRALPNATWITISPTHIMPSSRYMEIYNLKPNTTYEFKMWATNQLGQSPIVSLEVTTKGQYSELELARHLLKGADQFDTRWWAAAVGVVMGSLILLGIGTCVLLYQECRMPPNIEDETEIIELVPNIILNPGFEGPRDLSEITPDENSNIGTTLRLNNNTVIQPQNL